MPTKKYRRKQMKKIINAILKLYALPALVFSTTMATCVPSFENVD